MSTLLERLTAQRNELRENLNALIPEPGSEAEKRYSKEDDEKVGQLLADIAKMDERIADLSRMEEREKANAAANREFKAESGEQRATGGATVTSEAKVYRRGGENSWVADAYNARFMQDSQAGARLARYENELRSEKRDVGTGAFGALIPPTYLRDLFAPLVRAGRPTANAVTNLPLPDNGMQFSIPRGTTGTATAVQTAENTSVQETDWDETTLTVDVRTIAGQQDVSRQAFERGTGLDEIIFADLASDYAVTLDKQVLYGTGASGQMLGILATSGVNSVTYTDASPTVGELWPKIADAIQQIVANRYLPPTLIIMHPRRWAWFASALDSSGRPLVNTAGTSFNGLASGDDVSGYGQVVGNIQGLPVITDANVPTTYTGATATGGTEDPIIVTRAQDLLLWENSVTPRQLRFEETLANQLTVKLVVYGYAAFTAARYPKSTTIITGTGFAPPTF